MSDDTVTTDAVPTSAQLWHALRLLYGPKLVGATLVAIIDNGGNVTVQTVTFPRDAV